MIPNCLRVLPLSMRYASLAFRSLSLAGPVVAGWHSPPWFFFFSLDKCTKIVMFYFYASLLPSYLRASIRPSSPFGWVARFTREHHANGDMSARLARLPFHTRADRWDIWSCDKNRLRWLVTLTLLVFTRKFKRNNFDEYMSGGGFCRILRVFSR